MARIDLRRAMLGLLCATIPPVAHADGPPAVATEAAAPVAVAEPAIRRPGDVPPEELWRDFLAHADFDAAIAAYDVIVAVAADPPAVDAGRCREQRVNIDRALATVPVGLGLWFASYQCAEATGDAARAERDLAAFGALSAHAIRTVQVYGLADAPVRIVHEYDAWAIADASGDEVLFAAYEPQSAARHLPLRLSLWDAEAGRERGFVFDYVDTWMQLQRDQPLTEFPAYRTGTSRSILDEAKAGSGTAAALGKEVLDAMESGGPAQVVDALEGLVKDGNPVAGGVLAQMCLLPPDSPCAERAFDALLPQAEKGGAAPTALLAVALTLGSGVRKDEKAAGLLLDRADRRLGRGMGTAWAVALVASARKFDAVPRFLARRLDRVAADGDDIVKMLAVVTRWLRDPDGPLPDDDTEVLRQAAASGSGALMSVYGGALIARGESEGFRWLERAAEAGHARSQVAMARLYEKGDHGFPRDREAALRWRALAAHGGDAESALRVGFARLEDGDRARAQGWFESANVFGSAEGAVQWARLAAAGGEGIHGDPATAVAVLREVLAGAPHVGARRELAMLLLDGAPGVEVDRAEAGALLRANVEAKDATSMRLLAGALFEGDVEPAPGEDGVKLLQAAAADDLASKDVLALMHYAGRRVARDPVLALRLLREAADGGYLMSLNNLAWIQCVSTDPAVHAPPDGLAQARKLAAREQLPSAFLDTIAACHAANGDFLSAVEWQDKAIDAVTAAGADERVIAAYRERRALFVRGEVVRESPTGDAADARAEAPPAAG